jgi:hypothetical protein
MASDGSHGDFIPICIVEHLQGTVVGVQGQQMLVCVQDMACLLRRQRSSPQEPGECQTSGAPRVTNSLSQQPQFLNNRL